MHCEINTPIPEKWQLAWVLFEADQSYQGRSTRTLRAKRASVACMARCLTRFSISDPEQVTRKHMKLYLSEQSGARAAEPACSRCTTTWPPGGAGSPTSTRRPTR